MVAVRKLAQLRDLLREPHNHLWQEQLPVSWWQTFVSKTYPTFITDLEVSGVLDSNLFAPHARAIQLNRRKLQSLVHRVRATLEQQQQPDPLVQERIAETVATLIGILSRILDDTGLIRI